MATISHLSAKTTFLKLSPTGQKFIFFVAIVFCLSPLASPAIALLCGLLIAQVIGHPYAHLNHKATHWLLQASVVGLGFGMNLHSVMQAGKQGVVITIITIACTFIVGILLGKWFGIEKKIAYLITSGTAICGGSAIAAISPVIKAEEKHISVALGCVFILNAAALFIFPAVGHYFKLTQTQFGLWCAIAIHDTSSVVAASGKYGAQALAIATTVKLARALWIMPVAIISSIIFKNKSSKIAVPYFIVLFVIALLLNTYVAQLHVINQYLMLIAKSGLTLTLFLIGAGLSRKMISSVGARPFLQGVLLWLFISIIGLIIVLHI